MNLSNNQKAIASAVIREETYEDLADNLEVFTVTRDTFTNYTQDGPELWRESTLPGLGIMTLRDAISESERQGEDMGELQLTDASDDELDREYPTATFEKVQVRKGDNRLSVYVIDFGTFRAVAHR